MGLEPKLFWGCKAREVDSKVCRRVTKLPPSRMFLERATVKGESPVGEKSEVSACVLEYHGARGTPWESGGTTLQG